MPPLLPLLLWLVSALLVVPGAAHAEALRPVRSVLVKLRSEGPHAVRECAEGLSRRGAAFAGASADGSDSLDRLAAELGVRGVRSVFRRPDGTPLARQRQALRERLGARRRAEPRTDLAHVYRFELGAGVDAGRAAERLAEDPHVVYAQPNHWIVPDSGTVPDTGREPDGLLDDPFLHSSGSWGQAYPDQWGVHVIGAPLAWEHSLGAGVVVAIVDTGVDPGHPDLAANLWVNPGEDLDGDGVAEPSDENGLDDDGNGFVDDLRGWDFQGLELAGDADPRDENGHGTHVAGIAAARGDNGVAIAGVAPLATVMPVRVFPPSGSATAEVVWRGVLYALENGADVVNGSFSCGRVCRSNPVAEDVIAVAEELGVAYVTSAGNLASDVMLKSPERLRGAIVVGSTTPDGDLAASSSRGLAVDVVAPGDDVLSLAADVAPDFWAAFRFVGDDAMRLSGTSMAAPHVSGVLALLLAHDPQLTPEQLRWAIRRSALDLGAPGHDARFGAGLLQAAAALAALPPPDAQGVIRSPLAGDTVDSGARAIPVLGSVGGADLVAHRVELGRGDEPTSYHALARPAGADELARLPLAELPDGAYVLRLTLVTTDGSELTELTPFSLERSRPRLISSPDHDAERPDVSGVRVAWQSRRGEPDSDSGADSGADSDFELFQGHVDRAGEMPLVALPGDQTGVLLSRGHAAWRVREPGAAVGAIALQACRLGGGRAPCRPFAAASAPVPGGFMDLSGSRLVFGTWNGAAFGLATCLLERGACKPLPIAVEDASPLAPVLHRRRFVWRGADRGLHTCRLHVRDGSCAARGIESVGLLPEPRALAGNLLAYESATLPELDLTLQLCQLGADAGACAPLELARRPAVLGVFDPDISLGRVVWQDRGAHGGSDVYFCERAAHAGSCPVQRITHDPADQLHPRIDGSRVVWEDDRAGVRRIASFTLPELAALRGRVVRAGRSLVVPVRARGSAPEAQLSLHATPGSDPAVLGVRLSPAGRGVALLRWTPGPGDVGVHRFVLRATRAGGVYTERTLHVEVVPAGGEGNPSAPRLSSR